MYANLPLIARVEAARRREAEQRAAQWRPVRCLARPGPAKKRSLRQWRPIRHLARIRERHILRARLRQYAAR